MHGYLCPAIPGFGARPSMPSSLLFTLAYTSEGMVGLRAARAQRIPQKLRRFSSLFSSLADYELRRAALTIAASGHGILRAKLRGLEVQACRDSLKEP